MLHCTLYFLKQMKNKLKIKNLISNSFGIFSNLEVASSKTKYVTHNLYA